MLCIFVVLSELDTRKTPYHDVRARNKGRMLQGAALMQTITFGGFRPSLSTNCLPTVKNLFERCTDDDFKKRPSFLEIIDILDKQVRPEIAATPQVCNMIHF